MVNLSITELAVKHQLSVRSTNVCKSGNLRNLTDIISFFVDKHGFKTLPNCGEKSNKELCLLCNTYLSDFQSNMSLPIQEDNEFTFYNSLTPYRKSVFNRFVSNMLNTLSVRSINGLTTMCGNEPSPSKIIYNLYDKKIDFKKIKNIGTKAETELVSFREMIEKFINNFKSIPNENLSKEFLKLVIISTFDSIGIKVTYDLNKFFDINNRIYFFTLIHQILRYEKILNKNETRIFYEIYTINININFSKVASELGVTRERVRQIYKTIERSFSLHLDFVKSFNLSDCVGSNSIPDGNLIIIDSQYTDTKNAEENLNFNSLFYANIFSIFLRDSFTKIDVSDTDFNKLSVQETSNLNAFYFIRNNLSRRFNFSLFLNTVRDRLSERISESYQLYFEGFLYQFFYDRPDISVLEHINDVCEKLLFSEFELVLDSLGYLIFERNVKQQIQDYAVEALEELGEMSHLSKIMDLVRLKYADVEFSDNSIRGTMQREKNIFIFIGRSSTYGLKKWEEENENLRGGTIRDLVEEFLDKCESPKHISEILSYVNQFRSTNSKSVKTNIEMEENGKFITFPGDYVGLSCKEYVDTSIYKRLNGYHFQTSYLEKMNNWPLDQIIDHYKKKYQYLELPVRSILLRRVELGDFQLTEDKKLLV